MRLVYVIGLYETDADPPNDAVEALIEQHEVE